MKLGKVGEYGTNLAPPATAFFGRATELKRLGELFAGGDRVVTVLGPAGMGKTRLSLRFGDLLLRARSPLAAGGVWFCDLTTTRDENGLILAVGRGLDVPILSGRGADPVTLLGECMAERGAMLVILDNCE